MSNPEVNKQLIDHLTIRSLNAQTRITAAEKKINILLEGLLMIHRYKDDPDRVMVETHRQLIQVDEKARKKYV